MYLWSPYYTTANFNNAMPNDSNSLNSAFHFNKRDINMSGIPPITPKPSRGQPAGIVILDESPYLPPTDEASFIAPVVLNPPKMTLNRHITGTVWSSRFEAIINGHNLSENDPLQSELLECALGTLRSTELLAPKVIALAQSDFYKVLIRHLVYSDENYTHLEKFLNNLLSYIEYHHQTQFSATNAFRGCNKLSDHLNAVESKEFLYLLRLLIDLAPRVFRQKSKKEFNWNAFRENLNPVTGLKVYNNLARFFNINY